MDGLVFPRLGNTLPMGKNKDSGGYLIFPVAGKSSSGNRTKPSGGCLVSGIPGSLFTGFDASVYWKSPLVFRKTETFTGIPSPFTENDGVVYWKRGPFTGFDTGVYWKSPVVYW
jgi:hypothetical protein